MSLRLKFLAFTGLVVSLCIGSMALLSYHMQKELIRGNIYQAQDISRSQRLQASYFATLCRILLQERELPRIHRHIAALMTENQDLLYAYFLDENGRLRAHSDSRFEGLRLPDWERRKPAGAQEVSMPVGQDGEARGLAVLGYAERFQSNLSWDMKLAVSRMARRTLGLAALLGLLCLALATVLAWRLLRPLRELQLATARVASGDFRVELDARGGDELGELARRFTDMARGLAVLDELKDQFIANVSHDLRNPLAAIAMYAQDLLHDDKAQRRLLPGHRAMLSVILDNVRGLDLFVGNVLDAAKMKAGRMGYRLRPVDPVEAARRVRRTFLSMARQQKVELGLELPREKLRVRADPQRLEHALMNLVANALKFTQSRGRVLLRVRPKAGLVRMEVEDTGKGIAQAELARLFGRFEQLDVKEQQARGLRGTGLGLYIVKRTLEEMGGGVEASSRPGKGSCFALWLPRA